MTRIAALPSPLIDTRDLRLVLALADAGTTAGAAALLHLSQPAVSRALLGAEERLGLALFDRTPRGLLPTPAGERLVSAAARLLVELGEVERELRVPLPRTARLRVVCECYTAYHWLPGALQTLRKTLPGLEISLAVQHTAEPVAALVAGEIDAALLTSARLPPGPLEERPLFADEVVFVMARTHPLAERRVLSRADLRATTLLTSNVPSQEGHWFMQQVFGRARPRLRFERVPLTEAILELARAGMGVAVLSEWIAGPHLGAGDLVVRRLASGPLRRPWRLAWRRDVGVAGERLLAALEASVPRARLIGAAGASASGTLAVRPARPQRGNRA
jgi:LysR family transcriptional regulator for metE and metH